MSDPEARAWDGWPPDFAEAAWHWLFVNRDKPRPIYWLAGQWQMQGRWMMPAEMQAEGWAYLAPCVPPAAPGADEVEVVARALMLRRYPRWPTDVQNARWVNWRDDALDVLAALAPLRQAERERTTADERERIAQAIEAEADATPDSEDAMVTRDCAQLVRADFSYERWEKMTAPPPAHGGTDAE